MFLFHHVLFFLAGIAISICLLWRLYQFFFLLRPGMFVFTSLLLPVFVPFTVLYNNFSLPGLVRFLSSMILYCLAVFARFGLLHHSSFRLSAVFTRSGVLYS